MQGTTNPKRKLPYFISTLLKRGWSQKNIVNSIGVHPSTIYREVKRNCDESTQVYKYSFAHAKSQRRQQSKRKYAVFTSKVKSYIKKYLKQDCSPEQIAGIMKIDNGLTIMSLN